MRFAISPRDRAMTRQVLQGMSCRRVAASYGLCGSRVRQITLATVQRLYPYHPTIPFMGLKRLRQYAAVMLPNLEPEPQEER